MVKKKKKKGKLNFWEYCVFRKQDKVKLSPIVHRTKGTMDYIHNDPWFPSQVALNGVLVIFQLSLITTQVRYGYLL